jgi:hypothetical protein
MFPPYKAYSFHPPPTGCLGVSIQQATAPPASESQEQHLDNEYHSQQPIDNASQ